MDDQLPPVRSARPPLSRTSVMLRLAGIGAVVAVFAGAFYYVNGTLDARRLQPQSFVNALEQNSGVHPGYRRNHAKGMCVAGYFESSAEARAYSSAQVFSAAKTPVVGRFAFGTARLGLKSAMLSRVGDDHMGRFLVESLAREGCDVSGIKVDPERLTALVLLGLKDRETFPLVFYRENCADLRPSRAVPKAILAEEPPRYLAKLDTSSSRAPTCCA